MTPTTKTAPPAAADSFIPRHIGPNAAATAEMLHTVGYDSLDAFIDAVIPPNIRLRKPLAIHGEWSEHEALAAMRRMAEKNRVLRSYIGMGYADTLTPAGHPAQHPGEPRLVHGVHALPGGDRPGPARGAAQLPDDGHAT